MIAHAMRIKIFAAYQFPANVTCATIRGTLITRISISVDSFILL